MGHGGQRIIELARRHRLSPATKTQVDGVFGGQSEGVGDSGPTRRGGHWRSPPLFAGIGDRDEMSGQISAVDGGDISRLELPEIAGVVPIVEMAAKARHASHRRKGRFHPIDGLGRANPTEVARTDDGKQIQSDVGRRGSMGDLGCGVFLKVVRRQHIVVRRHKHFEEPPSAARNLTQAQRLGLRNLRGRIGERRQADVTRDSGRNQPQRR